MITQERHIQRRIQQHSQPITARRPHFLLLVDTDSAGKWRFSLEPLDRGEPIEVSDLETDVRGERLELLTVIRGLEALDQPSRVTLVTSSRYVARGICYGLDTWRRGNWHWERFGTMVPISNHDLWERLDRAMNVHQVRCKHYRWESALEVGEETEPQPVQPQVPVLPELRPAAPGRLAGAAAEESRDQAQGQGGRVHEHREKVYGHRPTAGHRPMWRVLPRLVRELVAASGQPLARMG